MRFKHKSKYLLNNLLVACKIFERHIFLFLFFMSVRHGQWPLLSLCSPRRTPARRTWRTSCSRWTLWRRLDPIPMWSRSWGSPQNKVRLSPIIWLDHHPNFVPLLGVSKEQGETESHNMIGPSPSWGSSQNRVRLSPIILLDPHPNVVTLLGVSTEQGETEPHKVIGPSP